MNIVTMTATASRYGDIRGRRVVDGTGLPHPGARPGPGGLQLCDGAGGGALLMQQLASMGVPYRYCTHQSTTTTNGAVRCVAVHCLQVYDSFTLPSLTFAAIVDDKKDFGALQYLNTDLADTWRGPMKKGTFLTCGFTLDVLHKPCRACPTPCPHLPPPDTQGGGQAMPAAGACPFTTREIQA